MGRVNAALVLRALNRLGADPFCHEVLRNLRSSGRMLLRDRSAFPVWRSVHILLAKGDGLPSDPTQLFLLDCSDEERPRAERRLLAQSVSEHWAAERSPSPAPTTNVGGESAAPVGAPLASNLGGVRAQTVRAAADAPVTVRAARAANSARTKKEAAAVAAATAAIPNYGGEAEGDDISDILDAAAAEAAAVMQGTEEGTGGERNTAAAANIATAAAAATAAASTTAATSAAAAAAAVSSASTGAATAGAARVASSRNKTTEHFRGGNASSKSWQVEELCGIMSSNSWQQSLKNAGLITTTANRPRRVITDAMASDLKDAIGAQADEGSRDWKFVCPSELYDNNWALAWPATT